MLQEFVERVWPGEEVWQLSYWPTGIPHGNSAIGEYEQSIAQIIEGAFINFKLRMLTLKTVK